MGGTLACAPVSPWGQIWTARWYFKNTLPPNRFKWKRLGGIFKTCYYLRVLGWGSPDPPKGPGDSGALTLLEFNDSMNFGPCFGAKADLVATVGQVCHAPFP